jgi:hypothetical protein
VRLPEGERKRGERRAMKNRLKRDECKCGERGESINEMGNFSRDFLHPLLRR